MKTKENEVKVLIAKEEYEFLKERLDFFDEFNQINFYYSDNTDVLERKQITVRIRSKAERLFLQIKEPIIKKGALHVHNEYVKELSSVPYAISSKELSSLCGFDLPNVQLLDILITERMVMWWNDTTQICLDKNIYLGKEDFEVEIEYTNTLDEKIINQFAEWHIFFDKDIIGKYQRFKQEYKDHEHSCSSEIIPIE